MRRMYLIFGSMLVLVCMTGAALADDGWCEKTITRMTKDELFPSGKQTIGIGAKTYSICGFPVDEGRHCYYDTLFSKQLIRCVDVDDWGKSFITIRAGDPDSGPGTYKKFDRSIPTQYVFAFYTGFFDDDGNKEWEEFFPSKAIGTVICYDCTQ